MERGMLTRVSSMGNNGSGVQLTSRLIVVPPFEDDEKFDRYRKRVSQSISNHSSSSSTTQLIKGTEEPDGKLLEGPSAATAFPDLRKIFTSRAELGKFLTENLYFQLVVVLLVAVNSILVIVVDLQVTSHDECHDDHDCPTGEGVLDHGHIADCTVNPNKTKCAYLDGHRQCLLESTPEDKSTLEILHYVGLAVLSLFVLEVLLRIFALGKKFFIRKLEVFDGVLVATSFTVYAAYRIQEPFHAAAQAAALLILLRVWRMKRIVNGITTNTHKRNMGKRRILQEQLKVYQERDNALGEELLALKEEVRHFRVIAESEESPPDYRVETSM